MVYSAFSADSAFMIGFRDLDGALQRAASWDASSARKRELASHHRAGARCGDCGARPFGACRPNSTNAREGWDSRPGHGPGRPPKRNALAARSGKRRRPRDAVAATKRPREDRQLCFVAFGSL